MCSADAWFSSLYRSGYRRTAEKASPQTVKPAAATIIHSYSVYTPSDDSTRTGSHLRLHPEPGTPDCAAARLKSRPQTVINNRLLAAHGRDILLVIIGSDSN